MTRDDDLEILELERSSALAARFYIDNYLEGYHLPHVHPGLSNGPDDRVYDTELARWHSVQHSPLRGAEYAGD